MDTRRAAHTHTYPAQRPARAADGSSHIITYVIEGKRYESKFYIKTQINFFFFFFFFFLRKILFYQGRFLFNPSTIFPLFLLARVQPTLPKQERPVREGARVASVETGLAAAAAKLAQQVGGVPCLYSGWA